MRARYYDAKTGRFIKEDPIGIEGGLNVSLYGNANPVVFVDPSGYAGIVIAVGGESTIIHGGGVEASVFVGATGSGAFAGAAVSSSTTVGLVVDGGISAGFFFGDSESLSGASTTTKTCFVIVCVGVTSDASGEFSGASVGFFAGTETGFGGGFSRHTTDTSVATVGDGNRETARSSPCY